MGHKKKECQFYSAKVLNQGMLAINFPGRLWEAEIWFFISLFSLVDWVRSYLLRLMEYVLIINTFYRIKAYFVNSHINLVKSELCWLFDESLIFQDQWTKLMFSILQCKSWFEAILSFIKFLAGKKYFDVLKFLCTVHIGWLVVLSSKGKRGNSQRAGLKCITANLQESREKYRNFPVQTCMECQIPLNSKCSSFVLYQNLIWKSGMPLLIR